MRLTKIKLAGFKSFVDPTTVSFPSNLTGVVGPNGCGKSNVIDAVRWVMGELSAKHLRGDSMADVVFNGSSARKPVGKASVELVFDNSDGKIGGAYAAYAEVSLRREVTRDGSSAYFINGARCRRKDITQLFLGTGLGSRSYAIIEQGMISRLIEAKADDMRAFVEEAAGISRYKERRKETESRIADTRENLERLQDLRDELDRQIRHLQRQAASARKYQTLKEQERRLTAELLALRLRDLDSGAQVQDSAMRGCELAMQSALADLRSAEAAIETQRAFHIEQTDAVSQVQGRFYAVGADISRTEQQIQFARDTRERKRADLGQSRVSLEALAARTEKVVVAGLSMGGSLTLRLAERHGSAITGVVLVNPAVHTERPDRFLLPVIKHVLGSFPGISNDIAKPGVDEGAYPKIPLKAAASMQHMWKVIKSDIAHVTQPLLLFRSAVDHVVEASNGAWIMQHVRSADRTEVVLERSYHVATLDYDAQVIEDGSIDFVRRLTSVPA